MGQFVRYDVNSLDTLGQDQCKKITRLIAALVQRVCTYRAPVKVLLHILGTYRLTAKGRVEATIAVTHKMVEHHGSSIE